MQEIEPAPGVDPATAAVCAHALEIVGVNSHDQEVLLRCTNRACRRRSRVRGRDLDVARVTTESLQTWRPSLRGAPTAVVGHVSR